LSFFVVAISSHCSLHRRCVRFLGQQQQKFSVLQTHTNREFTDFEAQRARMISLERLFFSIAITALGAFSEALPPALGQDAGPKHDIAVPHGFARRLGK
jgi:hypothetical protein